MKDTPEQGKVYALTGGTDSKCIMNDNSWKDSEVKMPEKIKPQYTVENFGKFIVDINRGWQNSGVLEIDEEIFDYFLGVLPPVFTNRKMTLPGDINGQLHYIDFGFAEGTEEIKLFWHTADRYFAVQSDEINRL